MPIYEYDCQSCGKTIDVLQKLNDPAPEFCSACGTQGSLSRVVSRTSFVLKGGGWYKDLYGSSKPSSGEASSTGSTSSDTSASSSTPSSTATPSSTGSSSTGSSSTGSASTSSAPSTPTTPSTKS